MCCLSLSFGGSESWITVESHRQQSVLFRTGAFPIGNQDCTEVEFGIPDPVVIVNKGMCLPLRVSWVCVVNNIKAAVMVDVTISLILIYDSIKSSSDLAHTQQQPRGLSASDPTKVLVRRREIPSTSTKSVSTGKIEVSMLLMRLIQETVMPSALVHEPHFADG